WDALLAELELHPAANNLRPFDKPFAAYRYAPAPWMTATCATDNHFGYLDRETIGDHQWFKGTGSNHIFSPALFEKLRPFGDIFEKWYVARDSALVIEVPSGPLTIEACPLSFIPST